MRARAEPPKVGFVISIDGDGFVPNPVIENVPVGQTRHLHLRHRDGAAFDADITNPAW